MRRFHDSKGRVVGLGRFLAGRGRAAREQLNRLGKLRAFLDSAPVNQRTDDDKTLVLATRLPVPPAGKAGAESEG